MRREASTMGTLIAVKERLFRKLGPARFPRCRGVHAVMLVSAWACARAEAPKIALTAPAAPPSLDATSVDTVRGHPRHWNYRVRSDEALSRLDIELCWEGPAPRSFVPSGRGSDYLIEIKVQGLRVPASEKGSLTRAVLGDAQCFEYALDLDGLSSSSRLGFNRSDSSHSSAMIKASAWMWRPHEYADDAQLQASFDLPATMEAATSWRVDASGVHHFDPSVFHMLTYTMLGELERDGFTVAGSQVEVVRPRASLALSTQGARAWISRSGQAVARLYKGQLPVERLVVMLRPTTSSRDDAVRFGLATRGGGNAIVFLVNSTAHDEAYLGGWTAIHEMLHFGMPYVRREDAWFSEGFATYYEQVVRARAGLYKVQPRPGESEAQAQTRASIEGFAKGFTRALRSTTHDAVSLADGGGSYTRQYWGGAAAWLRADVELRKATHATHSLDELMQEIWSCCAAKGGIWTSDRLLEIMKRKSRTWSAEAESAFEAAISQVVESAKQPDLGSCFADLAVETAGAELVLASEPAEDAVTRAAIFSPDP